MESPNDKDDRRILGWLSIEQAVSLIITLGAFLIGYGNLSSNVNTNTRDIQAGKTELTVYQRQLSDLQSSLTAVVTNNAQQRGEIAALQQGRDSDRKLLMDIAANVAVLLDRTDPKKGHP